MGAAASARSDTNHRGKGNSGSSRGNRATSKGRGARNALPPSNAPYWEQLQMMALQDSNVGLDIGSSDCQPPLPYDYQVAPQDQELVEPYPSLLQPFYATPTTEHLEAPPSTFSDACSFQPKPFVTSGDVADLTQLMRSQSFSSCAIPAARSDCDRGVARSRMSTDQMFSTGQVAAPPTWTPPRGMTAPTFGGNAIAAFQPPMMTDFNFDGVQTWGSDGSPSMMLSPEQGRWVNNLLSDASIYDPIGDSFSPDTQSQQRGPVSKTIVGDSLPCDLETLAWQPQQSRYHLISNPTHQNKPLSQKSQNLSFKKTPSPQDSRPKNQGGRKLFDRATRSLDSGRNEERTSQASRDVFTAESSARHPARDGNNLQDAKNNKRGGRGARGRNYSKPKAAVTSEGLDKENKA